MFSLHKVLNEGYCIWLSGLPGTGKTTTAIFLRDLLSRDRDFRNKRIVLIDGDELRRETGNYDFTFSGSLKNCLLAAERAASVVGEGDIVICSLASPFSDVRRKAFSHFFSVLRGIRQDIFESERSPSVKHLLIHVHIVCNEEVRKRRAPERVNYFGSFQYGDEDIILDVSDISPSEAAKRIISALENRIFFNPRSSLCR